MPLTLIPPVLTLTFFGVFTLAGVLLVRPRKDSASRRPSGRAA
jgi:hypothetical protein